MRPFLVVLVVTGCAGAPAPPPAERTPDVTLGPPACVVSTSAPESYAVTLQHDDQHGIECSTSNWDDTFELGYAHGGWLIHVEIPRALNRPGAIDLGGGTVGLLFQPGVCVAWVGSLTWADAPDWSVAIDATCVDDAATRVVGSWSGSGDY